MLRPLKSFHYHSKSVCSVALSCRKMSHFRVVEHTIRCQNIRERSGAVEPGNEHKLRLAVKQYIPKDNRHPQKSDVTLIGAHANGFPKELYEPLWDDIYERLGSVNRRIRAIWIADVAQQGQSGVLNETILGNDRTYSQYLYKDLPRIFVDMFRIKASWWDHGRDLLSLVNQYQDEIPHPIIGIGHSMGGMQLAHLSLMHPALFQALILIDPVIQRENPSIPYAVASTNRRDWWPSRKAAAEKFESSAFFKRWDPRVLKRWTEFALRDTPTELYPEVTPNSESPVTLTTPKSQELFTFLRPAYVDKKTGCSRGRPEHEMHPDDIDGLPFYRPEPPQVFRRLPELKPSVLYVFGETSDLASPASRQQKLGITGTGVGGSGGTAQDRVKEAVLPCGHLVPMEEVKLCATVSADFIVSELSRYEKSASEFIGAWGKLNRQERLGIDDQWKAHIGTLSKGPKL